MSILYIFVEVIELLERNFQSKLIKEIKSRFPGCIVTKNDPTYIQGIPDLTVFYKDKWATLECKASNKSSLRPNQEFYINKMNKMSFSSIINSDNKEAVLNELEKTLFKTRKRTRLLRSE